MAEREETEDLDIAPTAVTEEEEETIHEEFQEELHELEHFEDEEELEVHTEAVRRREEFLEGKGIIAEEEG